MKKADLVKKIIQKAKRDEQLRQDPRYLQTMGFLTAKGFLNINRPIPRFPNQRLHLADAIWAGQNVEPRILEVLPVAVLRLPKHFDLTADRHPELFAAVGDLRRNRDTGAPLWGIPFAKIRTWLQLPLRDRRIKSPSIKRATKTFRFKPETLDRLRKLSREQRCTETEVIERALLIGSRLVFCIALLPLTG